MVIFIIKKVDFYNVTYFKQITFNFQKHEVLEKLVLCLLIGSEVICGTCESNFVHL
jgi:hypothetical protein